jgi:hypothetical protein
MTKLERDENRHIKQMLKRKLIDVKEKGILQDKKCHEPVVQWINHQEKTEVLNSIYLLT